jgi:hypothetical protein
VWLKFKLPKNGRTPLELGSIDEMPVINPSTTESTEFLEQEK